MKKILPFIFILLTSTILAQAPECHWVSRASSEGLTAFLAVSLGSQQQVYGASINQGFANFHSFYDTTQISDGGGGINITLSRHDQAGNFVWQKRLYGLHDTYDVKMELDSADNIYILTMIFGGTIDFDSDSTNDYIVNPDQAREICVAKYNPDGDFLWARNFGISDSNFARELNILPSGNLLITGTFTDSIDLGNPGAPIVLNANGVSDAFVLQLDASGQTISAQKFGLEGITDVYGQCVDASGNYYLLFNYLSTLDVDPGPGTVYAAPSNGFYSKIAMVKFSSTGNLLWLKQFQNNGQHIGNTIQVNSAGEIYIIGQAVNEIDYDLDPDPSQNYFVSSAIPGSIAYLVKLNSNGDFLWAKTWETNAYGYTKGWSDLQFDQGGNLYIKGLFYQSVDMDPGPDVFTLSAPTNSTINPGNPFTHYLLSLNSDGDFRYALPMCDSVTNLVYLYDFYVKTDGSEVYISGVLRTPYSFKDGDSLYTFSDSLNPLLIQSFIAEYSTCPVRNSENQVTTCDSSFSWNGNTFSESGTYFRFYENEDLCDSIAILHLTKANPSTANLNLQACNSLTINNQTYSQSGTYSQLMMNKAGCDSLININFELLQATFGEIVLEACETVQLNGISYNQSGSYTQNLLNTRGCDSVLTIEAEILNLNAQIFQTDSMLYVNGSPTSIQWINCTTGQAIPGATQTSFVPQTTGNYGAVITIGECVDTSNCRQIIKGTAAEKPGSLCDNLIVSPNPVNDQIEFTLDKSSYDIRLFTSTGALLISSKGNAQKQIINFGELAPAMYVLQVDECILKIVKQ